LCCSRGRNVTFPFHSPFLRWTPFSDGNATQGWNATGNNFGNRSPLGEVSDAFRWTRGIGSKVELSFNGQSRRGRRRDERAEAEPPSFPFPLIFLRRLRCLRSSHQSPTHFIKIVLLTHFYRLQIYGSVGSSSTTYTVSLDSATSSPSPSDSLLASFDSLDSGTPHTLSLEVTGAGTAADDWAGVGQVIRESNSLHPSMP